MRYRRKVFNFFSPSDDDDAGEVVEMDSGNEGGEGLKDKASSSDATAEDKVYIPGQPLDEGEELVHDSSAYHMYHAVSLSTSMYT